MVLFKTNSIKKLNKSIITDGTLLLLNIDFDFGSDLCLRLIVVDKQFTLFKVVLASVLIGSTLSLPIVLTLDIETFVFDFKFGSYFWVGIIT